MHCISATCSAYQHLQRVTAAFCSPGVRPSRHSDARLPQRSSDMRTAAPIRGQSGPRPHQDSMSPNPKRFGQPNTRPKQEPGRPSSARTLRHWNLPSALRVLSRNGATHSSPPRAIITVDPASEPCTRPWSELAQLSQPSWLGSLNAGRKTLDPRISTAWTQGPLTLLTIGF